MSHDQRHAFILDLSEPETLVESHRGIDALDVDAQRRAGGGGFGLQLAHEPRPDAAVAVVGQQRDVDVRVSSHQRAT
jgi:hypothetical protein